MDFFNKLGNKISSGANVVANKTKDLAGTAKINMQISQDESRINAIFTEIGKTYYNKNATNPSEEFMASFQEITTIIARIEASKLQIQQIKGSKTCTNCGKEIAANVAFCAACGTKAPEAPVVEVAAENVSVLVTCPGCGKTEDSSVSFCSACGCKLK